MHNPVSAYGRFSPALTSHRPPPRIHREGVCPGEGSHSCSAHVASPPDALLTRLTPE